MRNLVLLIGVFAIATGLAACSSDSGGVNGGSSAAAAPAVPSTISSSSSTPAPSPPAAPSPSSTTSAPPATSAAPVTTPAAPAPTLAAPAPTPASTAWCTATASVYNAEYDENNVYVHSDQPYRSATASADGHSWSYETNSSGYALIYLNGPPPGAEITVTVGGATCTTSD